MAYPAPERDSEHPLAKAIVNAAQARNLTPPAADGFQGRWRGEISAGYDGAGRRIRRKVSGQTQTIRKHHDCLQPLLAVIGSRRLRELDADEVHDAPLRPVR